MMMIRFLRITRRYDVHTGTTILIRSMALSSLPSSVDASACHYQLITTLDGANEWAVNIMNDMPVFRNDNDVDDSTESSIVLAGISVAKSYAWSKAVMPLQLELSLPEQPVGVFSFRNIQRAHNNFPLQLRALLEHPNLRACGFSLGYDLARLRTAGAFLRSDHVVDLKRIARKQELLPREEGLISMQTLCRRFLPDYKNATGTYDTALRSRLLAEKFSDLGLVKKMSDE